MGQIELFDRLQRIIINSNYLKLYGSVQIIYITQELLINRIISVG